MSPRRPIWPYTLLAFELNALLDRGESLKIEDVKARIDDGSLLVWIKGEYPNLTTGSFDVIEGNEALELFAYLAGDVDEGRKFGIESNGLALLVAYCIEAIQQLVGHDP